MPDVNVVVLVGRLCATPEIRYLPKGTAVTELNIAINKKWRTEGGEDRTEVCFVSVTVWGKQAENCGKFIEKGSSVLIEGELKYEEWEAKEGGGKRHALKVTASRVQFLTFKKKDGDDEENEDRSPRNAPSAGKGSSKGERPPF